MDLLSRVVNNVLAPVKIAGDRACDLVDRYYNEESKENKKNMKRFYTSKNVVYDYIHFLSYPHKIFPHEQHTELCGIKNPSIYLGSSYNAACIYTLRDLGIKYVVNVTVEISNYYEDEITYLNISIRDNNNESIIEHLDDSFDKIDKFVEANDGNILIHCYMGASRSATIAANYIKRKTNMDLADIINDLTTTRPVVNPSDQLIFDLLNKYN